MIQRLTLQLGGEGGKEEDLTVEHLDGGKVRLTLGGRTGVYDARKVATQGRAATWSIVPDGGGPATLVDLDGQAPDLVVTVNAVSVPVKVQDARRKLAAQAARPAQARPSQLKSPMPGKVVKVLVKAGEQAKAGQPVVVVEAMKMENELKAPRDGEVAEVSVSEGQAVEAGQPLVSFK